METNHHSRRSSFSGKIGFVLAAAGASVGLGNIWRFPYLAAKYGGGIFLLVYILLAFTFGYTMIVAETALGRMTRKSPVGAFRAFGKGKGLSFGGWINAIIPILIVPYYSVIGGWVIKYLAEYILGHGSALATDEYFSSFISNGFSSELCFVVFALFTLAIIFAGVHNGIERVSKLHDARAGGAVRHHRHLFRDPARRAGGGEVLSGAQSGEFLVDDRRLRHGPDVLFAVHRHGHSHHLRLVHEKGRLHRRLHPERGDLSTPSSPSWRD